MRNQKLFNLVILLLLGLASIWAFQNPQPAQALQGDNPLSIQATSASVDQATFVHLDLLSSKPQLTDQQLQSYMQFQQLGPKPMPALPEGKTAVNRSDSVIDLSQQTPLPNSANTLQAPENPAAPDAPGSFTLYRNTNMGGTIKSQSAYVTEPTIANSGPIVFATGNWWGAISIDGGVTFSYVNPFSMFPASAGGLCCDQIVTYDPARDVFIWYLQYISSGSPGSGTNLFRVAVSHPDQAAQGNWWFYDFYSAANTEYDYPDLCLSNDYAWITTNRGPFNASYVNDAFVFKFPLDALAIAGGFSYSYLDVAGAGLGNLSLRCTRGAHETMYFGSHNTLSQVRIFRWAENSGTVYYDDVNLSAAWFNTTHVCPGPDGKDWCGFDDGRIKAGWVSQGSIGFMWGSAQGGGFTYPYVDGVRVRESDRVYIDRPILYNGSGAFAYPAASPNARGDVGIAYFFGGGGASGWYPYFGLSIDDDYSRDAGTPFAWDVYYVRQSTQGPDSNRWGDYISVRPFDPSGLGWIASGFTLQGCGGFSGCSEPSYTIFGRERDLHSVSKYFNPINLTFLPILTK
jgi:hypothetical protein